MKPVTRTFLNAVQSVGLDEALIRFSKIKMVARLKSRLWDAKDFEEYNGVFRMYKELLLKNKVDFKERDILEIGSGNSVGVGFFFLAEGARSFTGSDLDRNPQTDLRLAKIERKIARTVAASYRMPKEFFLKEQRGKNMYPSNLKFKRFDVSVFHPQYREKFDILLSSAVMEHIPGELIPSCIQNMAQYLRKGGILVHNIDLRDHVNVSSPFHFYRYSAAEWNDLAKNSIFYTNRWRLADFQTEFEKNGLQMIHLETSRAELPESIHPELLRRYPGENLAILGFRAVLRKEEPSRLP